MKAVAHSAPPHAARTLRAMYRALLRAFGPQRWWPAETPFEVMVGAVLTQNTNWGNVERAIANLRREGLLAPARMAACPRERLAACIRPAGYYNIKAARLGNFLRWLLRRAGDSGMTALAAIPTTTLREELLAVNGIGPETADSILLYALERPVFVVDAYTRRFLSRHGIVAPDASYHAIQQLFHAALAPDVALYNEYHALIVQLGKRYCRPRPRCEQCPLRRFGRVYATPEALARPKPEVI